MNRREYLNSLRAQLQGVLSQAEIEGHIRYYDEYISEEMAAGKTEEQVLEDLGSPILIAKTLTNAAGREDYYDGSAERQEEQEESDFYGQGRGERGEPFETRFHTFQMNTGIARWLIPVVLILIFILFVSLLGSVAILIARYFVPILVFVLIAAIIKSKKG